MSTHHNHNDHGFGLRYAIGITAAILIVEHPVTSVVICGIIVIGGLGLVRESVNILMEGTPAGMDLEEVAETISGIEGVIGVHDLHLWCIIPEIPSLSTHVLVDDITCSIADAILRRFGIVHTTLQFECTECGRNTLLCMSTAPA